MLAQSHLRASAAAALTRQVGGGISKGQLGVGEGFGKGQLKVGVGFHEGHFIGVGNSAKGNLEGGRWVRRGAVESGARGFGEGYFISVGNSAKCNLEGGRGGGGWGGGLARGS
jgi:hypothetical protein